MNVRATWERIIGSLWFVPGLMTVAAAVLAPLMVHVDSHFLSSAHIQQYFWLFGGTPEGARGVLVVIASSLITVTGVVFSITIVALQLASSQFTPRVLQNFTGDRGSQLVLGVFIGTFTYTLLVLRTVRSAHEENGEAFVPALSITLSVVLALTSIAFLIYYIDHVTSWIEASTIIDRVAGDTRAIIERRLPELEDDASVPAVTEPAEPMPPGDAAATVRATRSGYVQMFRGERIAERVRGGDVVVRVDAAVGEFVLAGAPLARVWPAAALDADLAERIHGAYVLGHRRTLTDDIELGLLQLSDIAVKALSPGINDPTTATMAVDRLGELVAELGRRRPRRTIPSEDGPARIVVPPLRFDRAVEVAFGQVRRYGAGDVEVMVRLAETVAKVAARVDPRCHDALRELLAAVDSQAAGSAALERDRARVRQAVRAARRRLADERRSDRA